jgi:hypothetical protein
MEVQHHINEGRWPRVRDVSIQEMEGHRYLGGTLDFNRAYELAAAYTYAPHISFMNLCGDHELERFVHAWGPLRLSDREREAGQFMMSLDWWWAFHRRFAAFGKLLESFQRPDADRICLRDFLQASEDEVRVRQLGQPPANSTVFLATYIGQTERLNFGTDFRMDLGPLYQEIAFWLDHAETDAIRGATAFVIERTSFAPSPYLKVEPRQKRSIISATLGLSSLEDALEWMIWNGYWMKSPLMFCLECRKAFRPETAHRRKYDTNECAHRATARKWRRKDLRRKRSLARKRK